VRRARRRARRGARVLGRLVRRRHLEDGRDEAREDADGDDGDAGDVGRGGGQQERRDWPETPLESGADGRDSRFWGGRMQCDAPEVRRADEPARSVGGARARPWRPTVVGPRRRVDAARRGARGV